MKKVIGLIPLYDDEKESYWMLPGYMQMLEDCGAIPIMLPLTENEETLSQCFEMCDGLLLTGGHDVDPSVYGCRMIDACEKLCLKRDSMEAFLFNKAYEKDLPVFGICRGIQFMNVMMGGTLYQDLNIEHPSTIEHHMKPPYDKSIHKVYIKENTLLSDIIGSGEYKVNSYHHQAIRKLGNNIEVQAESEDGLVEAISISNKKFMVGVQWHPEFIYLKDSKCFDLVKAFVKEC